MHLQLNHFKPVLVMLALLSQWALAFEPHPEQQQSSIAPSGSQESTTKGLVATPEKSAPAAEPQPRGPIFQLDQGTISGNTYTNHGLGLSTGFPVGWQMIDPAKVPEVLQANHRIAFGDSPEAQGEHESVWRCARILLWAFHDPDKDIFVVSVSDPACFPEFQLPTYGQDQDTIQHLIERLRRSSYGEAYAMAPDETVTTHVVQSHLLVDLSASIPSDEPSVHLSCMMMSLKDVWVSWMLVAPSADGLQELKKTVFDSLKFDAP